VYTIVQSAERERERAERERERADIATFHIAILEEQVRQLQKRV